jgi:hypothetical protein
MKDYVVAGMVVVAGTLIMLAVILLAIAIFGGGP